MVRTRAAVTLAALSPASRRASKCMGVAMPAVTRAVKAGVRKLAGKLRGKTTKRVDAKNKKAAGRAVAHPSADLGDGANAPALNAAVAVLAKRWRAASCDVAAEAASDAGDVLAPASPASIAVARAGTPPTFKHHFRPRRRVRSRPSAAAVPEAWASPPATAHRSPHARTAVVAFRAPA